jgi:hypothetical protein
MDVLQMMAVAERLSAERFVDYSMLHEGEINSGALEGVS